MMLVNCGEQLFPIIPCYSMRFLRKTSPVGVGTILVLMNLSFNFYNRMVSCGMGSLWTFFVSRRKISAHPFPNRFAIVTHTVLGSDTMRPLMTDCTPFK
jgi:hypothetical protein